MDIWALENKIRCVYKQVEHTKIAHLGITFDLGTRDEPQGKEGLVHFLEHMIFKGTNKRKAKAIVDSIESLGGEINAYTTKEKVYFHISILSDYWAKAFDVLVDICFYSIFPEKEMLLERSVIIEEMAMYEDIPEENIVDVFEEKFFEEHALSSNILGTRTSVSNISRTDFLQFIANKLSGEKVVFSAVAPMPLSKIKKSIDKKLGQVVFTGKEANQRSKPVLHNVFDIEEKKPINQVHCMMGFEGFALNHEDRVALFMLVHYLGGSQMSSVLNMELREKRGWVYTVEASYTTYSDTGLVSVYFGCDPSVLKKCLALVEKQIQKMCKEPISASVLKKVQGQIIAQLAMAEESNQGLMQVVARSLLDLGDVQDLEEVILKVKAVDVDRFMAVAKQVFDLNKMSVLKYLPN